ncbi:MAG: hypothetical protein HYU64_13680 [Armatimonadetes bacterium]|nr:hypothetical protein [Armatimonadota bacterium]
MSNLNIPEARMTLSPKVQAFFSKGVSGDGKVDATKEAVEKAATNDSSAVSGTWSNDRKKDKSDFMPKAQTIGGVLGGLAGGAVGYYTARMEEGKVVQASTKEPVYGEQQIGEIPKNHVTPGLSDRGTYPADEKGRPLPGTGNPVTGRVPLKNPDGTFQMQEKQETFTWGGPGMGLSIAGGIAIGAGLGVLAGTFVGILDKIVHPEDYPEPPPWNRSYSDNPWSNSYSDNTPWNRGYNDSPWNRSYYDSPWHNMHHDNPWHNSHSNHPWHNSHSNAPAWRESTHY